MTNTSTLPDNWMKKGDKLVREINFENFDQLSKFLIKTLRIVEKLNHHPNICFGYNKFKIETTTHEAEGITNKDMQLATSLEKLLDNKPN